MLSYRVYKLREYPFHAVRLNAYSLRLKLNESAHKTRLAIWSALLEWLRDESKAANRRPRLIAAFSKSS